MSKRPRIPNLGGARAIVLHRPHATVTLLCRQLTAIGLVAESAWPDLPPEAPGADFLFFDADLGFDEQFPWAPGEAPLPIIALIGSEAPGRIEWALSHKADAHLVKPVGSAGIYSALLIAKQAFETRGALADEIRDLKGRVAERHTIVQAVAALTAEGIDEERAFAQLRWLAMNWRVSVEEAARRVVSMKAETAVDRPRRA
jgi:AmiR/NasT family two-component response regulator